MRVHHYYDSGVEMFVAAWPVFEVDAGHIANWCHDTFGGRYGDWANDAHYGEAWFSDQGQLALFLLRWHNYGPN